MYLVFSNEHCHEKGENTWRAGGAGLSTPIFRMEESEAGVSDFVTARCCAQGVEPCGDSHPSTGQVLTTLPPSHGL